jgi:hypothetical protein
MVGFGWALFGFRINLPGESSAAQARWNAQAIENYRYRVQFSSMMFIGAVRITVEDGQVTRVEEDGDIFNLPDVPPQLTPISTKPDWYDSAFFSQYLPPDLSYYSVEGLFRFAESVLSQPLIVICPINLQRYEFAYNRDYGYIEDLRYTNCPVQDVGLGLACPAIGDCSSGFRITDFEILPDP